MSRFNPITNLTDAVFMPFKAALVVGLCALINAMTYHGHWWVKWVALGMGIATLAKLARAAKTLLLLGIVAWGGAWVYRRYGQQARDRFDEGVARERPQAGEGVDIVRRGVEPSDDARTPHRRLQATFNPSTAVCADRAFRTSD